MGFLSRTGKAAELEPGLASDSQENEMDGMSTTFWVAAAVLTVGAAALVWKLSKEAEEELRTELERWAARDVARWLSRKLELREAEVRKALSSERPPAGFREAYHEHVDTVILEFERTDGSDYLMEVCVEKGEDTVSRNRRELSLDQLPSPVQEAFLKGERTFATPWYPVFDKAKGR